MMKSIVTGGCGFIGSHLIEALLLRGDQVVIIDNMRTGNPIPISHLVMSGRVQLVEADIGSPSHLEEHFKDADNVFHLAALISVPESLHEPIAYTQTNTIGTLNVLEACRQRNVKNVVFSSSAAVYGNNPASPKTESMVPEPQSPYALTKFDGEYYFNLYRQLHKLNATVLRYFNVFGPRQDPKSPYAAVVPIFIEKALRDEDIIILGDGEQTRDFIYVKDVVQANLLAAEKGGDIFNVAYGQRITINKLAHTIIRLTHSKSKIVYQAPRANDIRHSQADISKISRELGFQPYNNLEVGLTVTIEDIKNRL